MKYNDFKDLCPFFTISVEVPIFIDLGMIKYIYFYLCLLWEKKNESPMASSHNYILDMYSDDIYYLIVY